MNFLGLAPYVDFLQTLALIAIGVFAWLRKPGADAAAAVSALRKDHDDLHQQHTHRLTTLEERVKHMPTSDELTELEGTVKAVVENTKGLADALGTVRAQLNRIENFLLNTK